MKSFSFVLLALLSCCLGDSEVSESDLSALPQAEEQGVNLMMGKSNDDDEKSTQPKREGMDKNLDSRLIGVWSKEFPVPSNRNGFAFFPNGYFVYCDYSDSVNIAAKYDGTVGFWKVEDDSVQVLPIAHYYWRDEYLEAPFGFIIDEKNELIRKNTYNTDWIQIGSFDSYQKKTFGSIIEKEIAPFSISLRFFQNSKLLNGRSFFQTDTSKTSMKKDIFYDFAKLNDNLYNKMIGEI